MSEQEKEVVGIIMILLLFVSIAFAVVVSANPARLTNPLQHSEACPRHESGHYTVSHPRDC